MDYLALVPTPPVLDGRKYRIVPSSTVPITSTINNSDPGSLQSYLLYSSMIWTVLIPVVGMAAIATHDLNPAVFFVFLISSVGYSRASGPHFTSLHFAHRTGWALAVQVSYGTYRSVRYGRWKMGRTLPSKPTGSLPFCFLFFSFLLCLRNRKKPIGLRIVPPRWRIHVMGILYLGMW